MKPLLLQLAWSLIFLLSLGIFNSTQAQTISPPLQAHIDSLFLTWNSTKTPGTVIAVIRDGQVLYQRAYGMANIKKKEPLTTNHSFWIASMAKQFTAMSIALLEEQGKLCASDDIRKYLPELPDLGETVRIEHLIHHTSGLRDGFTLVGLTFKGEKQYTNANVLAAMTRQNNLNFKPGERYEYLNGGYVLLAEIVARVSGMSFPEFTEQTIFRPLGMNHSRFYGNFKETIPGLVKGYGVNYKKGKVRYRQSEFQGNTVGSSGLVTTLADLIKWNENFYQNKLGKGSPTLITKILTPGTLNNGQVSRYAYGLEVAPYKEYLATSHSGSDPGYKAEMVRFPEQKVTVIGLANTDDMYSLTPNLLHVGESVIQNKVIPEIAGFNGLPNKDLSKLTGIYLNSANNQELAIITHENEKLFSATSFNGYKAPLTALAPQVYQNQGLKEYELRFISSEDGQVNTLQQTPIREDGFLLQKVAPQELTIAQLKTYAGKYYSSELKKTYHLVVRKEKLGLLLYKVVFIPFQPIEGNRFLADLIGNNTLVFSSNTAGIPTGFTFNRTAITNLQFIRKK
ncbi:serine hydrolase domain-containing protein [Adhaeribacter radiodurans]|uniref:Serine hydrolase n=1 Tax=Adhaeribacter radiodurans TaxID=2745197 RepID=A0A7L7L758_9BACT|nr:serine hydrolase domain-containing protein [Adhaeribacter radiodurans]QMU28640.1 serine hydrolase [Adhaeribacter radiodurans]